jgi:hypothetical protein
MIPVTADDFGKGFPIEERELLAEVMNRLLDKFENVALIAAHPTKEGDATAPVTASFKGSAKFLNNVSKKMYEQFHKEDL